MTRIRNREQGLERLADFDPFGALSLLDHFWPADLEAERLPFTPTMEVKESAADYVVRVELPGLAKDEAKVEFENGILTISGEKKVVTKGGDEKVHRSEIRYGSFCRSLRFAEVDGEKITATHADGVLTVTVPKSAKAQPRRIQIG